MSAGRRINTFSQSWGTPQKYVDAVKAVFNGRIELDPCTNEFSIVHAEHEFMLPKNDGLREEWNYKTIYVNPPYGTNKETGTSIRDWLAKCATAHNQYDAEVLALIPVATNTSHWKRFVFTQAHGICFLYDTRLRFLESGQDTGKGAPMACAMVYWGKNFDRFYEVFIEFGAVVDISGLIKVEVGAERQQLSILSLIENTPTQIGDKAIQITKV
jgi:hypothetical protein